MDRSAFGKLEFFSHCKPLWFSPPRVDAIETGSDVDVDETRIREPFANGLDGLRMVVHRRKHVERAQNFHLLELLVGVIEFRLVRDRSDWNQIANGLADERYFTQGLLQLEGWRNHPGEQPVDALRAHPLEPGANPVLERRKQAGVPLVDIDYDFTARTNIRHQAHEGPAHVGTMLQHTHAINFVERFPAQRNLIEAGLKYVHSSGLAVVLEISFHGVAQIKGENFGPGFQCNLREAAHAATRFQYPLSFHSGRPLRRDKEAFAAQIISHVTVELQFVETVPLIAERPRVFFAGDKSRHRSNDGKCPGARSADQLPFRNRPI